MAKKSVVARNEKRIYLNKKFIDKRRTLKNMIMDKSSDLSINDRIKLSTELSALPRNSAKVRIRNRCAMTGRPRGYYRHFGLSRSALRMMASFGMLPGVQKESL